MVDSHGEEVFGTGFDVEIDKIMGSQRAALKFRNQVLITDFGWMAIGFDVVVMTW